MLGRWPDAVVKRDDMHTWMQDKLQAQWLNLKQTFSKLEGLPASSEVAIAKLLKECSSVGADSLSVEVSLFKAAIHLKIWRDQAAASRPAVQSGTSSADAVRHAVQVWHIIARLWNGRVPGEPGILLKVQSSPDDVKLASGMLLALGFAEAALQLSASMQAPKPKSLKRSSSQAASDTSGMNVFR